MITEVHVVATKVRTAVFRNDEGVHIFQVTRRDDGSPIAEALPQLPTKGELTAAKQQHRQQRMAIAMAERIRRGTWRMVITISPVSSGSYLAD